jgi:hypothetical protein
MLIAQNANHSTFANYRANLLFKPRAGESTHPRALSIKAIGDANIASLKQRIRESLLGQQRA